MHIGSSFNSAYSQKPQAKSPQPLPQKPQCKQPYFGDLLIITNKDPMIRQNITQALQNSHVSGTVDPQVQATGLGNNADLLMLRTAYNRPAMFATKSVPGIQKIFVGWG